MPNQPKTAISGFRLDEETKERLRRVADNMGVTMTEAIRRATASMDHLQTSMREAMPEEAAHSDAVRRVMDTRARLSPNEHEALRRQFSGRLLDEVVSAVEAILDGRARR